VMRPTKKDSSLVFHPPPLMNVANTSFADPWGARYTSGIRMAKNPSIWTQSTSPSIFGSHLARYVLMNTMNAITA
jgi:hypothetical protein